MLGDQASHNPVFCPGEYPDVAGLEPHVLGVALTGPPYARVVAQNAGMVSVVSGAHCHDGPPPTSRRRSLPAAARARPGLAFR